MVVGTGRMGLGHHKEVEQGRWWRLMGEVRMVMKGPDNLCLTTFSVLYYTV